jgi:hypothetical protein
VAWLDDLRGSAGFCGSICLLGGGGGGMLNGVLGCGCGYLVGGGGGGGIPGWP